MFTSPISALLERLANPRVEAKLSERVHELTGYIPIGNTLEDDVFIAGYPKSGNTWVQNLLAGLVYGADPEFAPDQLVQDLIPDVHAKAFYKRYGPRTYFKTHELPRLSHKRVVYLLRDGRDVMVSYLHHLEALANKPVDFLQLVMTGEGLYPGKWHEHVQAWLANPYGSEMIVVRYEDLKKNGTEEARRLCAFAGLTRDAAFVDRVVAKASFDKMRKKEVQSGWDDPRWPKDKAFVRRGVVGSHKDEMPPPVLKAFLAEARDTLVKYGYA